MEETQGWPTRGSGDKGGIVWGNLCLIEAWAREWSSSSGRNVIKESGETWKGHCQRIRKKNVALPEGTR